MYCAEQVVLWRWDYIFFYLDEYWNRGGCKMSMRRNFNGKRVVILFTVNILCDIIQLTKLIKNIKNER